jgi:YopX protein
MREIKFRGRPNGPKWYYGSLVALIERDRPTCYITDKLSGHDQFVMPCTVGQFTGLHDVDGREIYEGDILQTVNGQGNYFLVFWNEPTFSFCLREYNPEMRWQGSLTLAQTTSYKWVVVGNAADNPELTE